MQTTRRTTPTRISTSRNMTGISNSRNKTLTTARNNVMWPKKVPQRYGK